MDGVVVAASLLLLTGGGAVVDNQSVMLEDELLAGAMYFTPIKISVSKSLKSKTY